MERAFFRVTRIKLGREVKRNTLVESVRTYRDIMFFAPFCQLL